MTLRYDFPRKALAFGVFVSFFVVSVLDDMRR